MLKWWWKVGERVKYALLFFMLLSVYLVNQIPSANVWREDGWWLGGFWYVTYELGLVSRGLVGSVVALFCERLSPTEVHQIVAGCWVVLALWVALFCGWLVKRTQECDRLTMLYLVTLFLVMPCSFTQYCNGGMFGKLDMFCMPLLLGSAGLLIKERWLWLLPVITAVGILIHPAFFFLFFPTIFFVTGFSTAWRARGVLIALAVVGVGLFGWLQVAGAPVGGAEALWEVVTRRSGMEWAANREGFYYAYFATLSEQWTLLVQHGARPILNALVVFVSVLAPVWLLPLWLWRRTMTSATTGGERSALGVLVWGPLLCALPIFLALDWTRWIGAVVTCQFVSFFVVYLHGGRAASAAVGACGRAIRSYPLVAGWVLLWLAILPRTEVSGLMLGAGVASWLRVLDICITQ